MNNIYIDSCNFGFAFDRYFSGIEFDFIKTIHVAGFTRDTDGHLVDTHMSDINNEVIHVLQYVLKNCSKDIDIILERDNGSATREELISELSRIDYVRTTIGFADISPVQM